MSVSRRDVLRALLGAPLLGHWLTLEACGGKRFKRKIAAHPNMSFSRNSAMRSTCRQAVSNSVARSF